MVDGAQLELADNGGDRLAHASLQRAQAAETTSPQTARHLYLSRVHPRQSIAFQG